MLVLVGKTFGIGNACLAIPMIKAIKSIGHEVDILVGSKDDDFGAAAVLSKLGCNVYKDIAPVDVIGDSGRVKGPAYDVAIMSIPFDGRWVNGTHYGAKMVMDSRRRPDNVDRLGFDMWKKHEVEYQMDNARALGYLGATPDSSFWPVSKSDSDLVYIGLGYKRDAGGFGASKHFGNKRFADLIREIRKIRPGVKFVSTGSPADLISSFYQIVRDLGPEYSDFYSFPMPNADLQSSFGVLAGCGSYIGNDTGMMHVAASMNKPTFGLFAYPDLLVKNPPWCSKSRSVLFDSGLSIERLACDFVDFVWGK